VPPGYEASNQRYPVLYMQDGQNLFDPATAFGGRDWRADQTADELIGRGSIEPLILVGIYNTGIRRMSEYTPTRCPRRRKGGKADRYAEMLAREVKPFIDHHYRTRKGASNAGVCGSSLGALASIVAALKYPRVFGKLAAMSPSVWWDNRAIVRMVAASQNRVRPRLWLDTGTAESENADRIVQDARTLRDTLLGKGWRQGEDLAYDEVWSAGHNEEAWGARFGRVLEFLYPKSEATGLSPRRAVSSPAP